jgi:hypothetical protein
MSVEVLLDTPEIAVIGPPATIELQLDIGSRGVRGSQIYSGFDDPNDDPPDAELLPNDLFIRASQGQTEGYIYQYLSDGVGGFQWEKIGSLKPSVYSDIVSLSASAGNLSASAGIYSYQVSIAEAFSEYTATSILANNLNIHISAEFADAPVVTSIKSKTVNNETNFINVDFYSIYYDSGSWSNLSDALAKYHITLSLLT